MQGTDWGMSMVPAGSLKAILGSGVPTSPPPDVPTAHRHPKNQGTSLNSKHHFEMEKSVQILKGV